MTVHQLEKRKERSENEIFVISKTDEGFRVYSPAYPTVSYIVEGSPEAPTCTCPDFQYHEGDPHWRCKHILAVLNQVEKPQRAANQPEPYEAEERAAIQGYERGPETAPSVPGNGVSQMVLKRSVSPDGRIDSLSVEFSCSVDGVPVREIKSKALRTLMLQTDIVDSFLNGKKRTPSRQHPPKRSPNGAAPAQMLSIGGMDGKWGRRLFINIQANGQSLRLFGSRKQLGEALSSAGYPHLAPHVAEGVHLKLPCRVITKPSQDGRYVNVERVLPDEIPY